MKKQEKVFMVVLGFLALTLFAFPMTASAASTYYVSPGGNDETSDGSVSNPWRTITYAISQASGGDTIKVMDDDDVDTDDYIENIMVDKSLTIERYNDTGANPQVKALSTWTPVFNVTADSVIIRGLDIYGATDNNAGIHLNTVTGCTIQDNRCGWDGSHNNAIGIFLDISSNYNVLTGNTCSSNSSLGIWLFSFCNYNTLTNNTVSNNHDGIYLRSSNNNTVMGNTASNNSQGILLHSSSYNTLTNNTASNSNLYGIQLYSSSYNTLTGNTTSNSDYFGIHLCDSSNYNTLTGNSASNNSRGIYLRSSSNNTIYLNNFSDNATANAYVHSSSGNIWNSPTTIYYEYTSGSFHKNYLGNYYGDYGGSDGDGDGIGDSPYSGSGMTDNHPLMATSDNYSLQAWWLHSDSIMYRDDRTKSPGSVTISGGGSHIWIADQTILTDISFSGDDNWTGQLVFTSAPASGHTFTIEMGSSTNGTDFTAGGPDATITGDGNKTALTYETDASAFAVVAGQYLALKITNNSGSNYDVQTGGAWSYCSSPDGSPDYIVQTEPIAGSDVTHLFKNYPNPVVSTTTIEYQLKGNVMEQDAIINIYNIRGQLVKTVEGKGGVAVLDASDLVNGIYFYQLKNDTFNEAKKMIILR